MIFEYTPKHPLVHLPSDPIDKQVNDFDQAYKLNSKQYTDQRRHASQRTLSVGDQVLVEQPALNKLSSKFRIVPYRVTNINRTMVTAKRINNNNTITRNISHFKQLPKASELPNFSKGGEDYFILEPNRNEEHSTDISQPSQQPIDVPATRKSYPKRVRRPANLWRKY